MKKTLKFLSMCMLVILISACNKANTETIVENEEPASNHQKQAEIQEEEDMPTQEEIMEMIIGDSPTMGPDDAPVTIIDFSDYFCPHCLTLYENAVLPVLDKYKNKIRFVSKQVVVLDTMAKLTTHASHCGEEQGLFWDMHGLLLETSRPFVGKEKTRENYQIMLDTSKEIDTDDIVKRIKGVEALDIDKFKTCMDSNKYQDKTIANNTLYQQLGLNGVPVVLINGKYYAGAHTVEALSQAIDAELN
jgi:protein-disulfide isomerase